jgi:hypothetical protein
MEFFKSKMDKTQLTFHKAAKEKPGEQDVWRLEDAMRAIRVFGSVGSGKASGNGTMTASSCLKHGGIVLAGSVEERDKWEKLAKEIGRSTDLVVSKHGEDDPANEE